VSTTAAARISTSNLLAAKKVGSFKGNMGAVSFPTQLLAAQFITNGGNLNNENNG
jgi:hypothetical protein